MSQQGLLMASRHTSGAVRPASVCRRSSVKALASSSSASGSGRRQLLAAGVALLSSVPSWSAKADVCAQSEADEIAEECRLAALAKDSGKPQDYNKATQRSFGSVSGVPVSVLDAEYQRATLELADAIVAYANADVNDYKVRLPLIKSVKADSTTWVSKYARGGSARKESSRRMYIAVDSVIGHISANGYAPMPAPKLKKVLSSIDEAKTFLKDNK